MELDPTSLSPAERYKLLIGCVVPRPIAFVTTIDSRGRSNLAPFSFFNGFGAVPMIVGFAPANRPDGIEKDTLRNAAPESEGGTGAFVVHPAVERYEHAVALAAEPLPYGESEIDLTRLRTVRSRTVSPPRLADAPFAVEGRARQILRFAPGEPNGANLVIGEVVHIAVEDGLVNERMHVDPDRLAAIGRMGGFGYCRTTDRFEMRPGVGGP